jgi:L-cysteine desulfidase
MLFFWAVSFTAAVALALQVAAQKIEESLPFNFTLAALNLTLPNTNATGVPLVLGQNGVVTGAAFEVTSVCTLS